MVSKELEKFIGGILVDGSFMWFHPEKGLQKTDIVDVNPIPTRTDLEEEEARRKWVENNPLIPEQ